MNKSFILIVLAVFIAVACRSQHIDPGTDRQPWKETNRRGRQAKEALRRSHRLLLAYYERTGDDNALLPRRPDERVWNARDTAADCWSHLSAVAWTTGSPAEQQLTRQTLADEIRLTRRLGPLVDWFDIDKERFIHPDTDLTRLMFDNAEYVKDGLLPLIDLTGDPVYLKHAGELLEAIMDRAPVQTSYGALPADTAEVCGDMLQSLSRLYGATRDARYKAWAERIGEAWLFGVLPNNFSLPTQRWDFAAGKPAEDRLKLNDHGNEIIFGLVELLMLEHQHDPERAARYLPPVVAMYDRLLNEMLNEDGLPRHSIRPSTGKILGSETPDTWAYTINGLDALYRITRDERYRAAIEKALKSLATMPEYREWGKMDSFADSIEGGILLQNRYPTRELHRWIEKMSSEFVDLQQEDGMVRGGYLDGNYARTALMWAMMNNGGTRLAPWREDLQWGATREDDALHLGLKADRRWDGKLHFDFDRPRRHLGLAVDYARINQYPVWFAVDPDARYEITLNDKPLEAQSGQALIDGYALRLPGDQFTRLTVRRIDTAPPAPKPETAANP